LTSYGHKKILVKLIFFKVKTIATIFLKIRKLMKNIHLFFSNTSYKL